MNMDCGPQSSPTFRTFHASCTPIILSRGPCYHPHFIEKGAEAQGWGSDKPSVTRG